MKIAIIGGTGSIGRGFALRWGQKHEVVIGSREQDKAKAKAAEYTSILKDRGLNANIKGELNATAALGADVVVLAIRYTKAASILEQINPVLDKQVIISVVVPMDKDVCTIFPDSIHVEVPSCSEDHKSDYFCYVTPSAGSAAQEIASMLPQGIELVSAFQNVPAAKLSNLDIHLDYDIGVCGNNMHSKNIVFGLIRDIDSMRPIDVGPIDASSMIECLTPLLLNIAVRNKMRDVGIKFVG